jgi:hypothetical protein
MYSIEYLFSMEEKKYASITDLLIEKWLRKRNKDLILWKTKHGDEISIKNMSDKHLDSAIECIKKVFDHNGDNLTELIL